MATDEQPQDDGPSPIGRLVRARREEKNLTQEELADLVGCSHAYISQLERKADPWFNKKFIKPISGALDIPMELILELEGLSHRKPGDPRTDQQDVIEIVLKMDPQLTRVARTVLRGLLEDAERAKQADSEGNR